MLTYKYSTSGPDSVDPIDEGYIPKDRIVAKFEDFPWAEELRKMNTMDEDKIGLSPSIRFENIPKRHGIEFSVVGDEWDHEFMIFYKRPKTVSRFFGLINKSDPDFLTEVEGKTRQQALQFLNAFLEDNYQWLEQQFA